MNINCSKDDLIRAVGTVSRAIASKNTLPVLNGILLIAEEGKFIMRTTDLDVAVQCEMPADVSSFGKTIIADGRRFTEIVRQLPDTDINMSLINDNDLMIKYNQSDIIVRGFDAAQFPELPEQAHFACGVMPAEVFCRMIKQVSFAAAADESRPVFTGIMTDIVGDDLIMVATDTHRLNLTRGGWKKTEGEDTQRIIVPAKTMMEVARIAQGAENIEINISRNNVKFIIGNTLFVSRIINGSYPDYKQVFPKEEAYRATVIVNKNVLLETLSRAALLARDNSSIIKLDWQKDRVFITADVPDVGNIKEEVPAILQGEGMLCAYNVRYIMDALKATDSDNVIIYLTGNLTPAVIKEENNEDYTALILPIRM